MLRRQGVVRALETMRLRLAEHMSLEYLAKTAAMSRFHFERVFHQITGLPPFQFLSAMRLVRARELVLATDAPITDICFDVGYNSVGTFTRRFTASVGVSPRRLRWFSQHRQEPALCTGVAASPDHVGGGADIVVHCRGVAEDARVFIGAFPSPVPIGRPKACVTLTGNGTVVLTDVPPGKHYVLAAARPASASSGRFGGVEPLVGIADAAPVQIEDGSRQEVTMQIRPIEVTDPPVVSFLPLLFYESCSRSLLDDVSPTDPAVTRARREAREARSH
jgi:AraC family transcriptional regulator